ncbi:MAG: alkaline phosphatase PhoX [Limisphaerales bacterium]
MPNSRRQFLRSSAAFAAGMAGLQTFANRAHARKIRGYGQLVRDSKQILDLPPGFSYRIISKSGQQMSDGFVVPISPDGMGAFAGTAGKTILVRNHEVDADVSRKSGAFGDQNRFLPRLSPAKLYDPGFQAGKPTLGGCTTIVYNHRTGQIEKQFLSLAGTLRNCAGGPTPWGSWLTCEESDDIAGKSLARDHGYVFEVPASEEIKVAAPIPLEAMGRFRHEAVAVDPRTQVVYLTEDRGDSLIYRFLPHRFGKLSSGGKLQALALKARPAYDTRNWKTALMPWQIPMDVQWIDLENINSKKDDLRLRGAKMGAAIFARGEGMWYGRGSIYFACTNGGKKQKGQIFKYTPGSQEGRETNNGPLGQLELFIEPNDERLVDNCDNITVSPSSGDLYCCEDNDHGGDQNIVGVMPNGDAFIFAHNAYNESELAGACFSPDGSTLFVNIYDPGLTLAITGPFRKA